MRMPALFLALMISAPESMASPFTQYSRSSTGAPFLRLPVGGRAVAMGEAYSALCDDAGAVYWNPAGLVDIEKRSATFLHAAYLDSISFDYGAYAQNLGKNHGTLGGSFHYLSAGKITETDDAGVEKGTFNPYDLAVALAYAYRFKESKILKTYEEWPRDEFSWLNGYSLGASAKFVRSRITAHSQTATFDLGLLSPWYLGDKLRFAVVLVNMGGVLRFDKEREVLPFAAKAGLALRLNPELSFALEGVVARERDAYAALGAEYRRPFSPQGTLMGRLGFNSKTIGEVSGATGLSIGLGLGYLNYNLDYAFVPLGRLGSTHQVSLTARF